MDNKAFIHHIESQLQGAYPTNEANALAWWIAEETTGLSRTQLLCGCKITKNIPNLQEIIDRLLNFEPIQYIFGHTLWGGLDLKLTKATLIPRPETAELVDKIATYHFKNQNKTTRVLDIGTGSGCIAIGLKKHHPEWQVTGIDISEEALKVAKENAKLNNVIVSFQKMDILSDSIEHFLRSKDESFHFDIIVSNPPYICEKEKSSMRQNVLHFEPNTAFFVPDDDPLLFYRRIASLFANQRSETHLFFEINENYSVEITKMLTHFGYSNIKISQDIYSKPRIIEAKTSFMQ